MNCLLTGGTGIVGSHILFDWLHKAIVEKTVNHLYVLIRNSEKSAEKRLLAILNDKSRPEFLNNFTLESCLEKITVISNDLSTIDKTTLEKYDFDSVIHCAGSTSLLQNNDAKTFVHEQNYLVTKNLLQNLPDKATRFLYISTAYAYGFQQDKVSETIENYTVSDFRNPYEKSKYDTEKYVVAFCAKKNISAQILRPSIICGRLIDAPLFETPKFDVFYAMPMFLGKYAYKYSENFRIWIDQNSGLNIVPVDFVSKAILHAFLNPEIKELNIVNPQPVLHKESLASVLKIFNINEYTLVSEKPENLNDFEKLYYKTIGSVFENYLSVTDLQFKTDSILKFITKLELQKNLGVHDNFMNLINLSIQKKFKKSY